MNIRNAVMRLHWQGYNPSSIATLLGVCETRVRDILTIEEVI